MDKQASATTKVIALLVLMLAPALCAAQASEDVHVVPLHRRTDTEPVAATAVTPIGNHRPLRVDVDLVLVPVTVTDRFNRSVTGLDKQDFSVLEEEQPQNIRYFSSEDVPISLGVVLDLSGSMKNKIDLARDAVVEFFASANPQDDYFVVSFANYPKLLADSTTSVGTIRDKLTQAKPEGRTALLDAIYMAVSKMRKAKHSRHALLVISDGGDNNSRFTAREIRKLVEEEDVEIYGIGIFDSFFSSPEEWDGKKLLKQITEATGGRVITLKDPRKLPEIAAQVSMELRNQYVLGYRPASKVGAWRKIQVKLTQAASREALRVHAKKGYMGPGE
jgi:Ca-activated chloride channel homolog